MTDGEQSLLSPEFSHCAMAIASGLPVVVGLTGMTKPNRCLPGFVPQAATAVLQLPRATPTGGRVAATTRGGFVASRMFCDRPLCSIIIGAKPGRRHTRGHEPSGTASPGLAWGWPRPSRSALFAAILARPRDMVRPPISMTRDGAPTPPPPVGREGAAWLNNDEKLLAETHTARAWLPARSCVRRRARPASPRFRARHLSRPLRRRLSGN
jgi:hypothetical protein